MNAINSCSHIPKFKPGISAAPFLHGYAPLHITDIYGTRNARGYCNMIACRIGKQMQVGTRDLIFARCEF